MKRKRRQGYMKDKYKVAKSAPSRSPSPEDEVPHIWYADADPEMRAVWDRVLDRIKEVFHDVADADTKKVTDAFEAALGFRMDSLGCWTMEQFQSAESCLTSQLAARRAA